MPIVPIHAQFCRRPIATRKVGQTDLVFGVRLGFISRSVCACKIASLCVQRLQFVPPGLTSRQMSTPRQHFDQLIWIAQPAELKTPQWCLAGGWEQIIFYVVNECLIAFCDKSGDRHAGDWGCCFSVIFAMSVLAKATLQVTQVSLENSNLKIWIIVLIVRYLKYLVLATGIVINLFITFLS